MLIYAFDIVRISNPFNRLKYNNAERITLTYGPSLFLLKRSASIYVNSFINRLQTFVINLPTNLNNCMFKFAYRFA